MACAMYVTTVWLCQTDFIFGELTVADIELLLAISTNVEWQIVILRNWTERWSAVRALRNCFVMCLILYTYVRITT